MADILIFPCLMLSVVAIVFAFSAYSQVVKLRKEVSGFNKKDKSFDETKS
jgi:hypothetical protein